MLELDLLTARESDFGFELLLVPERKRRDSSSLVQVAFWEHALKEGSCMRALKGRWPSNKNCSIVEVQTRGIHVLPRPVVITINKGS